MHVPLCCMIPLLVVKPILEVDMRLLENKFKNGYRDGDMVLYMSPKDRVGESQNFTTDVIQA